MFFLPFYLIWWWLGWSKCYTMDCHLWPPSYVLHQRWQVIMNLDNYAQYDLQYILILTPGTIAQSLRPAQELDCLFLTGSTLFSLSGIACWVRSWSKFPKILFPGNNFYHQVGHGGPLGQTWSRSCILGSWALVINIIFIKLVCNVTLMVIYWPYSWPKVRAAISSFQPDDCSKSSPWCTLHWSQVQQSWSDP